ncbi:hypothetical protein CPB83DRAFT_597444 [Crepidotus variabilis]|uniref:Uncharacterized protein n=1 Tax=Crepidotus variabilis TaxID=179855 RepID=A0A9P6E9C9_9AGAR|nr:hypothetical protein CPB83DRAFT_597444 [Crepidotus variabilis]
MGRAWRRVGWTGEDPPWTMLGEWWTVFHPVLRSTFNTSTRSRKIEELDAGLRCTSLCGLWYRIFPGGLSLKRDELSAGGFNLTRYPTKAYRQPRINLSPRSSITFARASRITPLSYRTLALYNLSRSLPSSRYSTSLIVHLGGYVKWLNIKRLNNVLLHDIHSDRPQPCQNLMCFRT